jgi:hypothetical protein
MKFSFCCNNPKKQVIDTSIPKKKNHLSLKEESEKIHDQLNIPIHFVNSNRIDKFGKKFFSVSQKRTPLEDLVIKEYTIASYLNINNYERLNSFHFITPEIEVRESSPEHDRRSSHILSTYIKKHPPTKRPFIAYKGIGLKRLAMMLRIDENKICSIAPLDGIIGKTMHDRGFVSTSLLREHAFNKKIMLEIEIPEGTNGIFLELNYLMDHEKEFLLDKNQKFKITSISSTRYSTLAKPFSIGPDQIVIHCKLLKK